MWCFLVNPVHDIHVRLVRDTTRQCQSDTVSDFSRVLARAWMLDGHSFCLMTFCNDDVARTSCTGGGRPDCCMSQAHASEQRCGTKRDPDSFSSQNENTSDFVPLSSPTEMFEFTVFHMHPASTVLFSYRWHEFAQEHHQDVRQDNEIPAAQQRPASHGARAENCTAEFNGLQACGSEQQCC